LKFCLGKKNELEILHEQDEIMRNKYFDPIQSFPDKIDQLLDALNRVCDFILFSGFSNSICFYLDLYKSTKMSASKRVRLMVTVIAEEKH